MPENFRPGPEDIKKAEGMMSEEQKEGSKIREEVWGEDERNVKKLEKISHAFSAVIDQIESAQESIGNLGMDLPGKTLRAGIGVEYEGEKETFGAYGVMMKELDLMKEKINKMSSFYASIEKVVDYTKSKDKE